MPRRSRSQRRQSFGSSSDYAKYFKERIYATFTGLAIILVVSRGAELDSTTALISLTLSVLGISAAGLISDLIAHLAAHNTLPRREEWLLLGRTAIGGIATLVAPVIILLLGHFGALEDATALSVVRQIYLITLVVVGWLACLRSELPRWKQLLVLVALVAFGLAVIGVQTLAHGLGEH